jgi:hypothetical protein
LPRRVFFSFHFQRDAWRVGQVRNCWVAKANHEATPFLDGVDWEKIQRRGDAAVKGWIDDQISGTSVTAVLIGTETYARPWVRYEIAKSFMRGNGMLGIQIHNQADAQRNTCVAGPNPFDYIACRVSDHGKQIALFEWDGAKWIPFAKLPSFAASCDRVHWGQFSQLSKYYTIYDWTAGDGYTNVGSWIEAAAKAGGR